MKRWCWTLLLTTSACSPDGYSNPSNASFSPPGDPALPVVSDEAPSEEHSSAPATTAPRLLELPATTAQPLQNPLLEAVVAARRPPPIEGGTMTVLSETSVAIADPARDSVYLVDLDADATARTVPLPEGSQPRRVVQGSNGRVHVVLRGSGELATIDVASGQVLARSEPCSLPRGVAHDATSDKLYVACAGGELVELDAAGVNELRRVHLQRDLRDVVSTEDGLRLSTFRSAELLYVDSNLIVRRTSQAEVASRVGVLSRGTQTMSPGIAWRAQATAAPGETLVLHQRAQATPLAVAYYGSNCASGIVEATISVFNPFGVAVAHAPLNGTSLAVDVAPTPDGQWLAVASPGNFLAQQKGIMRQLSFVSREELDVSVGNSDSQATCVGKPQPEHLFPGELTSLAFPSSSRLLGFVRQPAELHVFDFDPALGRATLQRIVDLDARDVTDSGHLLFHQAPAGGVSCASCHPGAGDDGHVWQFPDLGARRTQTLQGGVMQRAPFHWNGELPSFADVMTEIVQNRMQSQVPSAEQQAALASWIDAQPLERLDIADAEAVARGAALFTSAEVGCIDCHRGADFSSSELYDVGTNPDFALKAPTLLGIGLRSPLMHDGCAKTLRDRFNLDCGGDKHGKVEQLGESQLADLTAFIESL